MKKINYKYVALGLLFLSLIMLIIFKNQSICDYMKTIIISLSINVISSIVIIYMIDIKKENEVNKQLDDRRRIVYKSLISPIRDFDNLIYNMYKATTIKENINLDYFDINDLNDDKIFNNIMLIDIDKDGYVIDIYKKRHMLWKEVIISEFLSYIKDIKDFYNCNSQYIDNELSELLYRIISCEKTKNICNQVLYMKLSIETKDFLEILNLRQIFVITNQIKSKISNYISIENLNVSKSSILVDNISPTYASGIRK